jgi:hypothetical protein
VREELIEAVMDWPRQKADFEPDCGTLIDMYVQNATVEDWRIVLQRIFELDPRARLDHGGVAAAVPANFNSIFEFPKYTLSFTIGGVALTCHFFTATEIEFSFRPEDVSQSALNQLLAFMLDVGDATKKSVIMTPENCLEVPLFRYDSATNHLRWISPNSSRH